MSPTSFATVGLNRGAFILTIMHFRVVSRRKVLTIWIRAKPTLFTASIGYVPIFVRAVARNGES